MPSASVGMRPEKSPSLTDVSTRSKRSASTTLGKALDRLFLTDPPSPFSRSALRERFRVGAKDIDIFSYGRTEQMNAQSLWNLDDVWSVVVGYKIVSPSPTRIKKKSVVPGEFRSGYATESETI
jgi:hypothetical protein